MVEETNSLQNEAIEKLRLKYNFLKFVLGTFVISVLSLVINWQIQEKRLEFEMRSKESEFVARFLDHALEKELEKRRDFAEYFVRLSPSEDSRHRWEDYLRFVEELINKANETEKLIKQKNKELADAALKLELKQKEIEQVNEQLQQLSEGKGDTGKEAVNVEQLQRNLLQAEQTANTYKEKLDALNNEIRSERIELSSIRSRPVEVEVLLPIKTGNTAKKSAQNDYWDWTVYIEGPEQALNQIQYVEYTLHPTFPDPVRIVSSRGRGPHAFALSTSGWGTFTINIRVFLKNGQVQTLKHHLSFAQN